MRVVYRGRSPHTYSLVTSEGAVVMMKLLRSQLLLANILFSDEVPISYLLLKGNDAALTTRQQIDASYGDNYLQTPQPCLNDSHTCTKVNHDLHLSLKIADNDNSRVSYIDMSWKSHKCKPTLVKQKMV